MIEDVFRLFVVESPSVSTPGIALAVRVHQGTVKTGDHVRVAVDPDGDPYEVDLEVRYLAMSKTVQVDTLDENYGGLATFVGLYPKGLGEGCELAG